MLVLAAAACGAGDEGQELAQSARSAEDCTADMLVLRSEIEGLLSEAIALDAESRSMQCRRLPDLERRKDELLIGGTTLLEGDGSPLLMLLTSNCQSSVLAETRNDLWDQFHVLTAWTAKIGRLLRLSN